MFVICPGLVRTEMTAGDFPDDAPWTPPELAPELVRKLATGRYDALAGRYIHAEHDDVDDLLARIDEFARARPERDPAATLDADNPLLRRLEHLGLHPGQRTASGMRATCAGRAGSRARSAPTGK